MALPPYDRPRAGLAALDRRAPLVTRLGAMVVAFAVIAGLVTLFGRDEPTVVETVAAASPAGASTTVPATLAPTRVPTTVPTTVAPTTVPTTLAVTAASPAPRAVPATTAKKPVATTVKKPVATTAKKPVATTVKKPVATTTKPVSTTKKPVATTVKKPVATTMKPVSTTKATVATTAPKPVVTTAAPRRAYTKDEIRAIIRSVWPDDLEDRAIAIATRETNLNPYAFNWCCYGLFAIYFNAGKRLLNGMGITSPEQLFDPVTNARAGYAIYQAAGWDPWKL